MATLVQRLKFCQKICARSCHVRRNIGKMYYYQYISSQDNGRN